MPGTARSVAERIKLIKLINLINLINLIVRSRMQNTAAVVFLHCQGESKLEIKLIKLIKLNKLIKLIGPDHARNTTDCFLLHCCFEGVANSKAISEYLYCLRLLIPRMQSLSNVNLYSLESFFCFCGFFFYLLFRRSG